MFKHIALAGIAAVALASGAALAQDKTGRVEIRPLASCHPSAACRLGFEVWAQIRSSAASGGSIKVTMYPAQQLGKAPDHYDMARDGIADIDLHQSGLPARPLPDHSRGRAAVPDEQRQVAARPRSMPGTAAYAEKEMKDVKFCLAHLHDPGTCIRRSRSATRRRSTA
jgi:TRAP-type transport system periplasmic protein